MIRNPKMITRLTTICLFLMVTSAMKKDNPMKFLKEWVFKKINPVLCNSCSQFWYDISIFQIDGSFIKSLIWKLRRCKFLVVAEKCPRWWFYVENLTFFKPNLAGATAIDDSQNYTHFACSLVVFELTILEYCKCVVSWCPEKISCLKYNTYYIFGRNFFCVTELELNFVLIYRIAINFCNILLY